MANKQVLAKKFLREIIKLDILRAQPIRRRNPAHTRQFMHIHQRPAAGKQRFVPPVDPHHARHDPEVVLPAVAELVPPLARDDLGGVDLVDCPEISVGSVEEDGLKDVIFVWDRTDAGGAVFPKLVLVVGAVEGHLDFLGIRAVGLGVVHGPKAGWLAVRTWQLPFGEGDLLFLGL